jgi:uncharacterized SAM-binding protein YcdF (DUF218 family)
VFFFLSKLLDIFLAPLSWSLFLLVAGAGVLALKPARRRLGLGLLGAAFALLYVFSLEWVANTLQHSLEDTRSTARAEITYDAVILLGGVVQIWADQPEGARSYNDNVERLLATYDYLRTDRAKFAVISGGHPDPNRPEAKETAFQAAQLADWGIDPSRIVIEARARNTYENAVEVKKIADERGWKNIVIVTSAFHMTRALGCFAAVGLPVDSLVVDRRSFAPGTKPTRWVPQTGALEISTEALHEHFGRVIYRLRGYAK